MNSQRAPETTRITRTVKEHQTVILQGIIICQSENRKRKKKREKEKESMRTFNKDNYMLQVLVVFLLSVSFFLVPVAHSKGGCMKDQFSYTESIGRKQSVDNMHFP